MIQEVFAPDETVMGILRRQSAADPAGLRWSVFLFPFQHKGACYLYHSLTKQCLRVNASLYEAALPGGTLSCGWTEEHPKWKTLEEQWFLVPEEKNEAALFEGLQRILRLRTARSKILIRSCLPRPATPAASIAWSSGCTRSP